jgi:hypothetical protein
MLNRAARLRLLAGGALLLAPVMAHAGQVVGTVSDASGTRTLASAQVTLVELGRTVQADRAGGYRFTDKPAGRASMIPQIADH